MRQKNTHTKGWFSALKRRAEISVSVVLSLLIFAGPVEASTWKPTALVNTEAFHSIDDTDAAADVVLKFGDTLAKTLTYDRSAARFEFNDQVYVNGNLMTMGTMSGAHVHAEKSLTSSGTILSVGNITGRGTLSGQTVTGGGGVSQLSKTGLLIDSASTAALARIGNVTGAPGGNTMNIGANSIQTIEQIELAASSLHLNPNGGNVGINKPTSATVKSALDVVGTISGTTVSISSSINGAGLTSCSNATTSKLLYDSATGRFSCGTDQTGGGGSAFSTGNVLTIGSQKYVSKQGDTMTGTLAVNIQGGTLGSIGINAVNTISGAIIHAEKHLTSSGGVLSFGDIVTKGALRTSGYGLKFASGAQVTEWSGFNNMINIQTGNLGIGGIKRLGEEGNLTNIGSIQSGEITATIGGTFQSKIDYPMGASTYVSAIADVNGDGKQDLAVASFGISAVSVRLNTGTGSFGSRVDYPVGTAPAFVGFGDLNGDGKPDMVVVNNSSSNISVLINSGTGSFRQKVDYATGAVPYAVAIRDFNGDGKADLAVTSNTDSAVGIFINNGNGTFAAKVDYTVGSGPRSIVADDFNGDGKADLAIANYNGANANNVSVLYNRGNGTFGTKIAFITGNLPRWVSSGDVNGDGKPDLVVANYSDATVSVFTNTGTGSFGARVNYNVAVNPFSIAIGDLDGDGKADLAVACYTANSVAVLLNKGSGTFAGYTSYATGQYTTSVAMGDLNGDGKADLVTSNSSGNSTSVLFNNSKTVLRVASGTGGGVGIGTATPGSKLSVSGSVIINPNGNLQNGKADTGLGLEVIGALSGSVIKATNSLNSSGSLVFEGAASGSSLYLGTSLQGAGLTSCNDSITSKLLYNSTTGRFGCGTDQDTGGAGGLSVTSGDERYVKKSGDTMTGALNIEIRTAQTETGALNVHQFTQGTGAFIDSDSTQSPGLVIDIAGTSTAPHLLFGYQGTFDTNLFRFGANTLRTNDALEVDGNLTIRGTASGNIIHAEKHLSSSGGILAFGDIITKAILKTTSYGLAFASGAVLNEWSGFNSMINIQNGGLGTNGIARLSNQGNLTNIGSIQSGDIHATMGGTFTPKTSYATGTGPRSVAIGDLNGDGKADLAVGAYSTSRVSVLLNTGTGVYAAKVDYVTDSAPNSIAIGDLNGDGKPDIVTTNESADSVSVLMNKGDGTFASKVDYTVGDFPISVAIGDINGDGKADLAVANYSAVSASVLLNTGNGLFGPKTDYTTGTQPRSVALGDVNGDGKADMAVANNASTTVSVFLNSGNGLFAAKTDYATGTGPYSVVIADMSGDGKSDIAVLNNSVNSVSVLLNTGAGIFATHVTYGVGSSPFSLAAGDLNGDGKVDLAVANYGAASASVLLNKGKGTFAAKVDYTVGTNPRSIAIGDVNGDGKADLATAESTDTTVSVLLNNAQTLLFASAGTGGVVGIGTATPGSKLSVSGAVLINNKGNIGNTSADAGLALEVVGTISGSLLRAGNMTVSGAIVYSSGSTLMQTAKGFSGQILVGRGTGTPEWKSPTGTMVWYLDGNVAVGANQGAQVYMPFGFRPTGVKMLIKGAPTGAALIADLKQDGVSIFSGLPQINAGATTGGSAAVISASIINSDTVMTLDITQVGSTFSGSGLTVLLNGSRRY